MTQSQTFHGPLRVGEDGRYLVDARGEPFFWMGDTAWPLYAQYTPDDAEAYLANRAARGFTVIQGVLAWGHGTGMENPEPVANHAGERPWRRGPDEPNDAYFRNVDHLLDVAERHGLVLAMLPTWGYYVNNIGTFNPENARVYGRWLGERYRERPNVLWVNGGDRIPTGHEDTYRALAQGLREGDGGAHPITYHPCGWRSSAQFFHTEDWLDLNMIETWTQWPQVYHAVLADTHLTPRKPVVLGEGAYENGPEYPLGPITPLIVRRQAWWAFMAGGFITYGQDRMWRMGEGWTETFDTPGAVHMGVFRQIATSRPWWQMVPDQSVFASGVSSERTLNTALRTADSTCIMIYLASQCHVRVNLDKILTREVRATWVDPQTGEEHDAGTFPTGNLIPGAVFPRGRAEWFSTPGHWEDAVLILDAVRDEPEG
jgi:hypothetical protein